MPTSFKFFECTALIRMTGRRAGDIVELVEILKQVSAASIFHHMHQYFLKPHVRPPAYHNDFAEWAAHALEEKSLAERFANINPYEFSRIEDVRAELVRIATEHLKEYPQTRRVRPGNEFFFNEGITLVMPVDIEASTHAEFLEALKQVDYTSIYFHFYEARLRLGNEQDDFTRYFDDCLECGGISTRLKCLDPYVYGTEVLREKIIEILEDELR